MLTPARDWCPSPLADSVSAVQNYQPVSAMNCQQSNMEQAMAWNNQSEHRE